MTALPTATYRLQLREGMDFARAETLVPYLADLGVSHLYLSPIFTAASGSTHGYDVADPNEIEPSLGGREGLESLSEALKAAGLGLILDIVPNHMAFGPDTPWLMDVLRHGQDSRYAHHFDIDWSRRRLRLPWLSDSFEALASAGEITVDGDHIAAPGLRIPLAVPAEKGQDVRAVHAAQPWRLTHWRTEASAISHRRFFTVTGLIGLRVEDEAVFEDVHRLTFELVEAGIVDGLRVDHVDGLADPAEYLDRLHARLPGTPVWIEKILTGDEGLPPAWPVEGTTGYVAGRAISQVLTDGAGAEALAEGWAPFARARDDAKTQIVTTELQFEIERLADLADVTGGEWGRAAWREALLAYIRAFPRYRTYTTLDAVGDEDAALIRDAAVRAASRFPHPGALPDLADLLTDTANPELRLRLQQLTGAAIAKAQEDTAFYRYVPYLAANEVGAEPDHPALDAAGFHAAMERRAREMPHGLTLTSSHDTKRSEDARARIMALSHQPEGREMLLELVPDLPHPWRWYLAQSAFAAQPDGDLAERLPVHMEKAMREAKRRTFWAAPNETFEARIIEGALEAAERFDPLPDALKPLAKRADGLALAQAALKLTVPGIPDIYQGTEVGSHLLTDPDNRAAVDFDALARRREMRAFDRRKMDLTRTLLRLRRDEPEAFASGYEPLEAPEGQLRFARGPFVVTVDLRGEDLEGAPEGEVVWPREGAAPARVERR
ncbi:malto-oligosyltrehalose synthase [Jannaschia sp. W003]|uniref:malto-oligosyltrehalose synthase n=1 Tax=Jannaschia sp. W003 TaxID=2867012 RepID=UPI0021A7DD23|nr:malto-oligosyltrehalose synthase [Jannaschia sp. W003]UWQ21754.1 malto-oligosyltrehalose synthase [Jannaschia sp. W003]